MWFVVVIVYFLFGSVISNDDFSSWNVSVFSVKLVLRCNFNGLWIGVGVFVLLSKCWKNCIIGEFLFFVMWFF